MRAFEEDPSGFTKINTNLISAQRPDFIKTYDREDPLDVEGYHLYALPLPIHPKSGFTISGMGSFQSFGVKYPVFLTMWQLFCTLLEDFSQGTPDFKLSKNKAGSVNLAKFLYLHAARLFRNITLKERKVLEACELHSPYFFGPMAAAYRELLNQGATSKRSDNEPAPVLRIPAQYSEERADMCFWGDLLQGRRGYGPRSHVHSVIPDPVYEAPSGLRRRDDADSQESVPEGDSQAAEKEKEKTPYDGINLPGMSLKDVDEKCKVYYVPVRKQENDPDQPYAGYIMLVVQKDENWNPGVALGTMMDTKSLQKRYDVYKKLWEYRKRGHPAFTLVPGELVRNVVSLHTASGKQKPADHEWRQLLAEVANGHLHNESHTCHPKNWATLHMAFEVMKKFGADPTLLNPDQWATKLDDGRVRLTPPSAATVYNWPLERHTQACGDYIGIYRCVWPHDTSVADAARAKLDTEDPLGLCTDPTRLSAHTATLYNEARRNGAFYATDDIIQQNHFQSLARRKKIQVTCPLDPAKDAASRQQYKEYASAMIETRTISQSDFNSAMQPGASLTDPMQALVQYAHEKVSNLTCTLYIKDPSMDTWGNYIIRLFLFYRVCLGVEEPIVSFMGLLALAAYDFRPGKMLPQVMLCGAPGVGKTFPLLKITEITCIPNTTREENYKSALADTAGHDVDGIVRCDEGESFRSDKTGSAKENVDKVALDSGIITTVRAKIQKDPDGQSQLIRHYMTCVHNKVNLVATNFYEHEMNDAIVDRFMVFIKSRSYKDTITLDLKSEARMATDHLFYNQQIAVAWIYKAIAIGVIEDIDLSIYNLVIGRMLDYLKQHGVADGPDKSSTRTHRKILCCLRHFVVLNAVQQVVNLPGGACYNDPHWKETLPKKASPHLYPTKQLFLWCVMFLRSMWVNTIYGEIIRAACAVAGLYYDSRYGDMTHQLPDVPVTEDFVKNDPGNKIRWKRDKYDEHGRIVLSSKRNFVHVDDTNKDKDANAAPVTTEKLDLNYVELDLSDEIYARIADAMPQRLQIKFVKQKINEIANKLTFHPERGRVLPVEPETVDTVRGTLNTKSPTEFAREGGDSYNGLFIMERKRGEKKLYVAPLAAGLFDEDLLLEAFNFATVHAYCRPQKYILPVAKSAEHRHILETYYVGEKDIEATLALYKGRVTGEDGNDSEKKASKDPYADAQQEEDAGGDENVDWNKPLPRTLGLSFFRSDYCNPQAMSIITAGKIDPTLDDEQWKTAMDNFRESRSRMFIHIYKEDLDDWCARQRHYTIGLPLESPIMTQLRVRELYKKALLDAKAHPSAPKRMQSYPGPESSWGIRKDADRQIYQDITAFDRRVSRVGALGRRKRRSRRHHTQEKRRRRNPGEVGQHQEQEEAAAPSPAKRRRVVPGSDLQMV